jgi:6-phosphofructo-2-kinase / fructose-2,6-biphosphatase 4
MININQRMEVRNATGYLASRIVFYLMNLHTQRRTLYFARAGRSLNSTFKSDEALSPEGKEYAQHLTDCLLSFRQGEHAKDIEQGEKPRSLTVLPPMTVLTADMDINSIADETNRRMLPS